MPEDQHLEEPDYHPTRHLYRRPAPAEQRRGVRELQPLTRTTFWRGVYAGHPDLRAEFLKICGIPQ